MSLKRFSWILGCLVLSGCSTLSGAGKTDCACGPEGTTGVGESSLNRLVVGIDRFIELNFEPASTGLFVGDPRVLRGSIAKSGNRFQLALRPQRAGESSIEILNPKGEMKYQATFVVTSEDLSHLATQLTELLRPVQGLAIKVHKTNVVLDGELTTLSDFNRVALVAADKHYTEQVLNLTTLSPKFFSDLAPKIETEIKRFAPEVTARVVNSQIWLEGHANHAEAERAMKVANLSLPASSGSSDPLEELSAAQRASVKTSVQNFITVSK